MNYLNNILYYSCFLMCLALSLPGYAQRELVIEFDDGEKHKFLYTINDRKNELIRIQENTIEINSDNFDSNRNNRQNSFGLNTVVDPFDPAKMSIKITYPKTHLKIDQNRGNPKEPSQLNFVVTKVNPPPALQEIRIQLVSTKDHKPVGQPLILNLIFKPPKIDLGKCLEESENIAKLNCLESLKKEAENEKRAIPDELNKQIEQIRELEVKAMLNRKWQIKGNSIICQGCDLERFKFNISPDNRVQKIENGWKLSPRKNTTFIISSIDFSTEKKEFNFKALPKRGKELEQDQLETENEEEVLADDNIEEGNLENSSSIGNIPEKDTTDSVEIVDLAAQYWIDSIQTKLDFMAFINPSQKLSANLDHYLKQKPDSTINLIISYTILWRLWLIPSAILIFFIGMRLFRKPAGKKDLNTSTTTVPITSSLSQDNGQEQAGTSIENTFEIEIEEVEEASIEAISKLTLEELAQSESYLPVNLMACWKRSRVKQIYIHKQSISDIHSMLKTYNTFSKSRSKLEDIPEIGGFILGHTYSLEEQQYDVSIETFVPITAESQNRYTVKFGDKAWMELDDALKANPGMKLVGWFHTHPGHGLFLSEADLREHQQLFREPYQFALEIDPLTPQLDMAIFTWQQEDKLNNKEDRLLDEWWSFEELINKTSKA